jgi:hypothetical protein
MVDTTRPSVVSRTAHAKPTRYPLTLCLRSGETVSGHAEIPALQSLRAFLTTRRGGVLPLSDVKQSSEDATQVVLRLSSVLYIWSTDPTLRSDNPMPGLVQRRVRLSFDDQIALEGNLSLPASQPVADFFGRAEDFIILGSVRLPDVDTPVDLAIYVDAINMVRDLGAPTSSAEPVETVVQRRNSKLRLVAFPDP